MFKRILVPSDGSDVARQAVAAALALAQGVGAEIVAFSVAQPAPLLFAAESAMVADVGVDLGILQDQAQRIVDEVAAAARAAGVPCRTLTVVSSVPADAIVEAIVREGCDLVVMGSHGRRGLARLFAGSQTRQVLAAAPVPVLVLRPAPGGAAQAANTTDP